MAAELAGQIIQVGGRIGAAQAPLPVRDHGRVIRQGAGQAIHQRVKRFGPGTDGAQHDPVAGIAPQPGQQTGAQERGFAATRRTQDEKQPGSAIGMAGAQLFQRGGDFQVAPVKHRRLLLSKGRQAGEGPHPGGQVEPVR